MTKKCTKCFIEKSVEEFHRRGSGYKSQCKECRSRKSDATKLREKRKANGEKLCPDCNTVKPHSCFHNSVRHGGVISYCKPCIRIRKQLHHVNNADKISAKRKKHYAENKELYSERKRKHYAENKEQYREQSRVYREENKEQIFEQKRKYYEENKQAFLDRSRDHYQRNKSRYIASAAKRRAALLNATPDDADLEIIRLIYENCPDGYEVDHIVPIDRGGLHHQDNLAYLPMSINRSKGTKLVEEFPEFHEHVIYPKLEEQYGRTT